MNATDVAEMSGMRQGLAAFPLQISVLLVIYGLLFIVGICGNVWVIVSVGVVLWKQLGHNNVPRQMHHGMMEHVFLFVMALSIVDLLVLMNVPLVISFIYYGEWLFSRWLCKMYWTMENVNKLLSVAILTVLSVERYMAVCHPFKCMSLHSKRTVLLVIGALAAVITLLLLPIIIYTDVHTSHAPPPNEHVSVTSCSLYETMPDGLLLAFIGYMFSLGYCVPAVVIGVCYMRLLCFVKKRFEHRRRVNGGNRETLRMLDDSSAAVRRPSREVDDPIRTLTKSVLRVVFFYYACWTPFWASVLIPLINSDHLGATFLLIQLYVNTLPYVNASGNWILYALLNRQLRESVGTKALGRALLGSHQPLLISNPLNSRITMSIDKGSPNGSVKGGHAVDSV
uniref:G-protein coupled receptors family 1 profile domain-containing protein n=1 Tax=Plectus sambesii TaxID=2011161 RepID=A0A914XEN6_9BILA